MRTSQRERERVQARRNQCAFDHFAEVRRHVSDISRRSQDCVSTYTIHLVYLPVPSRLCDKTNGSADVEVRPQYGAHLDLE